MGGRDFAIFRVRGTVFVRLERVLAAQKAQIDWKRVLLCI